MGQTCMVWDIIYLAIEATETLRKSSKNFVLSVAKKVLGCV